MPTEIIYSIKNELEGWANPSVKVAEAQLRAWLLIKLFAYKQVLELHKYREIKHLVSVQKWRCTKSGDWTELLMW